MTMTDDQLIMLMAAIIRASMPSDRFTPESSLQEAFKIYAEFSEFLRLQAVYNGTATEKEKTSE